MPEVNELLTCTGNRSSDFVCPNAQASFNGHFRGPGWALGPACVCVCVCMSIITFERNDIWLKMTSALSSLLILAAHSEGKKKVR